MPWYNNIDDVIYDGEESVFRRLVFYASLCATVILNIEVEITGEYQMLYPRNPTIESEAVFAREYRTAFDIFIPFFENI